jgi:hypothetical protein
MKKGLCILALLSVFLALPVAFADAKCGKSGAGLFAGRGSASCGMASVATSWPTTATVVQTKTTVTEVPATALMVSSGDRLGILHRHHSRQGALAQARADHARFAFMAAIHQHKANRHGDAAGRIESRRGVAMIVMPQQAAPGYGKLPPPLPAKSQK